MEFALNIRKYLKFMSDINSFIC